MKVEITLQFDVPDHSDLDIVTKLLRERIINFDYYNELVQYSFITKPERSILYKNERLEHLERAISAFNELLEPKLNDIAERMEYLKEAIRKSDIIIDIHNTTICSNKLLVTTESLETLPKWKTYSKDYQEMVIWRLSKFESLSEYARKLGKISFTAEFGGMVANEEMTPPNDLLFLRESIDLCMDLFEMRKFQESENPSLLLQPLFTEYNKLVEVELNQKTFLYPGQLIEGKNVLSINSEIDIDIINESVENYNYKIVSPEANYGTKFEGTIIKPKILKNTGEKINE